MEEIITVHLTTSTSPQHIPAQYRFKEVTDARRFIEAAVRSETVLKAEATNVQGSYITGLYYKKEAK